jgi:hypothetical protein
MMHAPDAESAACYVKEKVPAQLVQSSYALGTWRHSWHNVTITFAIGLPMDTVLNAAEIAEIDKQDPNTASDGGFQGLMVSLQKRIDRSAGQLHLTADDLRRIPIYAFDYRNGGWETRLINAFSRALGPKLGR